MKIEEMYKGQLVIDSWGNTLVVREVLKTRIKVMLVIIKEHMYGNTGLSLTNLITYDRPHLQFLSPSLYPFLLLIATDLKEDDEFNVYDKTAFTDSRDLKFPFIFNKLGESIVNDENEIVGYHASCKNEQMENVEFSAIESLFVKKN